MATTVPNVTEFVSQAQKQATASIEAGFEFAERLLELQRGYTLKMAESYFNGKTPPTPCDDNDLKRAAEQIVPEYLKAMDELAKQMGRGMDLVWPRAESAIYEEPKKPRGARAGPGRPAVRLWRR